MSTVLSSEFVGRFTPGLVAAFLLTIFSVTLGLHVIKLSDFYDFWWSELEKLENHSLFVWHSVDHNLSYCLDWMSFLFHILNYHDIEVHIFYCNKKSLNFESILFCAYTSYYFGQWVRSLDLTTHTRLSPIRCGFTPGFVNYKKGALDSQSQVIKFTSCLPMVGGSHRVLRLPPPLKLIAMI